MERTTYGRNLSPGRVFFAYEELKAEHIRLRMRGPRNLKEKILNSIIRFLLPRKKKKAIRKTIGAIQRHIEERIIFLEPPFFLVDAARYVLRKDFDIKLTDDSILASTGGFKGREMTTRGETYDGRTKETREYLTFREIDLMRSLRIPY